MSELRLRPARSDLAVDTGPVLDWIIAEGLHNAPVARLIEGTVDRLLAAGLPVLRVFVGIRTLHPLYNGYGFVWQRSSAALQQSSFARTDVATKDWQASPFAYMREHKLSRYHRRLDDGAEPEFPVFKSMRADGGTDYLARVIGYDGDNDLHGVIFSWLTDRPEGFAAEHFQALDQVLPVLSLAIRASANNQIAHSVLETYIGHDAGDRVLSGQIQRGSVETLRAVLLFADLRGFTRMADRLPGEEIVPMLDDYLDAIGTPVMASGGEILKFMGDGLLAVFEIGSTDSDTACHTALGTVLNIFKSLDVLDRDRLAAGKPTMQLDIALHLGDVLYGNVGTRERLDFTVIGPAVNEASRIETLCQQLDTHVLVSSTFARAAAAECQEALLPVGRHALRDLDGKQELFTIRPEIIAQYGRAAA